jgi:hypothetical protein
LKGHVADLEATIARLSKTPSTLDDGLRPLTSSLDVMRAIFAKRPAEGPTTLSQMQRIAAQFKKGSDHE